MGGEREGVKRAMEGVELIKVKSSHSVDPSRNPFGINNERQECEIGIGCWGVQCGRRRKNGGDKGEGIWWMSFIYIYKKNNETSCNCFKWDGGGAGGGVDGGADLTDVLSKAILNCHNKSLLYNKYILIKMRKSTYLKASLAMEGTSKQT
jgi:hypothetical protein